MERAARTPDPASRACPPSRRDPPRFATEAARSFFQDSDCVCPPFIRTSTLPYIMVGILDASDLDGVWASLTMVELLPVIDLASAWTAPGPNDTRYEIYNITGLALT